MGATPQYTGRRRGILMIWILTGLLGAGLLDATAFGQSAYLGPTASTVSVPAAEQLAVDFDGLTGIVSAAGDNLFEVDLTDLPGEHAAIIEVSEAAAGLTVGYVAIAVVEGACDSGTRFGAGRGAQLLDLGQQWSAATFADLAGGSTYCIGAVPNEGPDGGPTVIRRASADVTLGKFIARTEPMEG